MPRRTKRTYKRKPRSVKKLAAKVAKVIEKKELEHKYIDKNSANAAYSYSGTVVPISFITQGTSVTNRIGDKINPLSLNIRGRLIGNGANVANTTQVARFIVFMDRQSNGALPNPSDVLQVIGSAQAVYSPMNTNTMGRFHILFDKVYSFDNQTLALGNAQTSGSVRAHMVHCNKKLRHVMRFQSNNGDITDALNNQYYVLILGNVNSNDITAEFYSRITFVDA